MTTAIDDWRYRIRLAVAAAEGTEAEELLKPLLTLEDRQIRSVCFLLSVQKPRTTLIARIIATFKRFIRR